MKTRKLTIGIVSTITVGIIIYFIKKSRIEKNKLEKRLVSVADAGYETAHDILFPLRSQRLKRR